MSRKLGPKESVRLFIDKNYSLLSVAGVFAAISAYFLTLESVLARISAFMSFLIFLFVCFIIYASFPKTENCNFLIRFFESIFQAFFLVLTFFLFVQFTFFAILLAVIISTLILNYFIDKLFEKHKYELYVRKLCKKVPRLDFIIRSIFGFIPFLISFVIVLMIFVLFRYLGIIPSNLTL